MSSEKFDYTSTFQQNVDLFKDFHSLVRYDDHFSHELRRLGLLQGVKSLLSIGAGQGALEIRLAKTLGLQFSYVEPTRGAYETFLANVRAEGIESQMTQAFPGPFEQFETKEQFDLVIAIQSWYAFGCNEAILRKALSLLRPGGKLFLALITRDSLNYTIGNLNWESEVPFLCAEQFSQWATGVGLRHRYDVIRNPLPWKLFFTDGKLSRIGEGFVGFLCYRPWQQLSPEQQQQAVAAFEKYREGEQIHLDTGCLTFEE